MALRPLTLDMIEANYAKGIWQDRPLHSVIDDYACRRPDAPAVADQHERLTYAELVRRSHSVATWLLKQGLEPGACVALQTPNSVSLAITHLACDRADLMFLPLSNAWRGAEVIHLLKTSQARIVMVPPTTPEFDYLQLIEKIRPQLPHLQSVGTSRGDRSGSDFAFEEISVADTPQVSIERDPNVPRFVMVTSGTTALPKMSQWTDNNLWNFMQRFIRSCNVTADDVAVGLAPANTGATGYVFAVLGPLLAGASSVLLEHWDVEEALDLLESERATLATAIPTQVVKLLQDSRLDSRDFTPLRAFTNAGAAMPPEAAEMMEKVFGCVGHVCYGTSDGGVPTMTAITDPPEKRHFTVGKPDVDSDVRLVDALGEDVLPGQSGEILWRGPTKSFGYFNEPHHTEAAFGDDGWYSSGDLGRIDAEGYLSIVGRAKDLIIRGGQNISPQELELHLYRHPAIAEVSVIGIPDAVYGERTCACVVLKAGKHLTLSELTDFLEDQEVAKFKFPERLEIFDDLPKSAGGKITKVELRAAVAARS
ncbi:AMP-binding protein [Gordonia polyisoprenivorans]|uniref:AMP-binding protein n=1 Tax=Gordonia polyisoprenivorans TaxID=84595 RepID=UPI001AD7C6B1|nr:AMP-binding protein [Gordonia polyisoprenivorans]QTI69954.1 AMP-binding protein [Gordonia polyisoprenivorans]